MTAAPDQAPRLARALVPIAQLHTRLDELARPANRRLGQAVAAEGAVHFALDGAHIVATVTGPPGTARRRVTFAQQQGQLHWRCTCISTPSVGCKHVVAAVLAAAQAVQAPS